MKRRQVGRLGSYLACDEVSKLEEKTIPVLILGNRRLDEFDGYEFDKKKIDNQPFLYIAGHKERLKFEHMKM